MATYYVDDGGSNTSPYDTWAKASPSLPDLDAAVTIADGDIIYVGSDMVEGYTYSANYTLNGPAGGHAKIISATVGTTTYAKATSNQIDTAKDGSYQFFFDAGWALFGLNVKTGSNTLFAAAVDEELYTENVTIQPGNNSAVIPNNQATGVGKHVNLIIDLTQDGSNRSGAIINATNPSAWEIIGGSIINGSNRNGSIISPPTSLGYFRISGFDFSSCNHATPPELIGNSNSAGVFRILNCKLPSNYVLLRS